MALNNLTVIEGLASCEFLSKLDLTVNFIDVDAFPQKRDGFRYTGQSFLEMWKDKKKAHQPDSVSYAALFRAPYTALMVAALGTCANAA